MEHNPSFFKYKNKILIVVGFLVLCISIILLKITFEKKPEKITKMFECLKEIPNKKESGGKKNHEILEILKKNYLQKLALYYSSEDLIQRLSETLQRLNDLVNDEELRGKIDDNHSESFIKNVISDARDANSLSHILHERFSYKTISIYTDHILRAIGNKHLKFAGLKIKDIFAFTNLSKKEINKAKMQITSLFINSNESLKLQSHINYNHLIFISLLLVLVVYYQKNKFKKFFFNCLVGLIFYILIQYHFANNNKISYKVKEIYKLIDISSFLIDEVENIHSQYSCELSKMETFIDSILSSVGQQEKKITEIISLMSKEESDNLQFGKSRAQYLLDAKLSNLNLVTPTKMLPPELIEEINNLKAFISHVLYETIMYFSKVKSISDLTIKFIDELKFHVNDKRIFNFNKFVNHLIDINQQNLNQVQPLIEYLSKQIKSVDNIVALTEKAKRENISKEELKILYKKFTIAGATFLLGGGTPVSIGMALVGYLGSDFILNHESLYLFKEINEKFEKFFSHIKKLQNFLINDTENLTRTKSKLVSLQEHSKNFKRDISELINDENEESVITSYALNEDFEIKIIMDGLDLIRMKNEELLSLTSEIINEKFKLN